MEQFTLTARHKSFWKKMYKESCIKYVKINTQENIALRS